MGVGATLVMDLWLLLLQAVGVPALNFRPLGRWVGHMPRGHWVHDSISKAAPVRGELALGWIVHYLTGISFALLFTGLCGPTWLRTPTLLPFLAFGIGTVALPLFVMQPAMGAGFASARTATPVLNRVKSLANHTVFGLGLYAAALAAAVLDHA
ncbi:DUF2938 domain-containing protein [Hylemonella gracilis]|uniref:DUF2938 domain-containing protein n=1 Tax=Hylemonella gracilis TaxID=80880 RepID=A0A4P6UPX4_9BURK|nr:DUF2938 domain-containing protein [Hylemonella gracilis]QBK06195.1 DUF2938 domain-containing protein [Hylemonella gracilis]